MNTHKKFLLKFFTVFSALAAIALWSNKGWTSVGTLHCVVKQFNETTFYYSENMVGTAINQCRNKKNIYANVQWTYLDIALADINFYSRPSPSDYPSRVIIDHTAPPPMVSNLSALNPSVGGSICVVVQTSNVFGIYYSNAILSTAWAQCLQKQQTYANVHRLVMWSEDHGWIQYAEF